MGKKSSLRDSGPGARRLKQIAALFAEQPTLKIGILGQGMHDGSLTNAEVGAIHEFGAPRAGIPERSFLRATADAKAGDWSKLLLRVGRLVGEGKLSAEEALSIVGEQAVMDVRSRITDGPGIAPPLQPATIRRKGSSRPLVDSGRLVQSIGYEVTKGRAR